MPQDLAIERVRGSLKFRGGGVPSVWPPDPEKYPEKIPFRLTRMLINAMEVAGVDGTFKHTAGGPMGNRGGEGGGSFQEWFDRGEEV